MERNSSLLSQHNTTTPAGITNVCPVEHCDIYHPRLGDIMFSREKRIINAYMSKMKTSNQRRQKCMSPDSPIHLLNLSVA